MKKKVRHERYPDLGIGVVKSEQEGKSTVQFADKLIVFPTEQLIEEPLYQPIYVYRNGERYEELSAVRQEMIDWIVSECRDWKSVSELVKKATTRFADYVVNETPFLNQGGFDPMFVVSRQHPGALIKSGLLIFKKAPPKSGHQWIFKARAAASREEILSAIDFALIKNKFVFVETKNADNDRPGIQAVDSCVAAGGV
jgi:hypothetical protein